MRLLIKIFFFNDTATTEIYTLSLHDALPISFTRWPITSGSTTSGCTRWATADRIGRCACPREGGGSWADRPYRRPCAPDPDRKSTRLNSSHSQISYAVFCLKKKITIMLVLES